MIARGKFTIGAMAIALTLTAMPVVSQSGRIVRLGLAALPA